MILENIFYGVFGLLMQRNGQKRYKKKSMGKDGRKKVLFSQLFRPKVFDMDFSQKVFNGVFELPLMRNAQKRHKKKKMYLPAPFSGHLPDIRRFQLPIFFFFGAGAAGHFLGEETRPTDTKLL
jgi:hypothetical protein